MTLLPFTNDVSSLEDLAQAAKQPIAPTAPTVASGDGFHPGGGNNPELGGQLPTQKNGFLNAAGGNPELGGRTAAAQQQLPDAGMRAILSALNPDDVYGANGPNGKGIMSPLARTRGMIFPYTPTIAFAQSVNYQDLQLVHSNYDFPAYSRTPTCTLSVTGKFTVQNQTEGLYALAAIHFLRTASKSYFGETDAKAGKAGLPPPVLQFSAYGIYIYNKLRVILKSHSWSYEDGMDTVVVKAANGSVRLPAMFTVTTELMVVQTPTRVRRDFSFDAFASGKLMEDGGWL